jgi:hypothetical protein
VADDKVATITPTSASQAPARIYSELGSPNMEEAGDELASESLVSPSTKGEHA